MVLILPAMVPGDAEPTGDREWINGHAGSQGGQARPQDASALGQGLSVSGRADSTGLKGTGTGLPPDENNPAVVPLGVRPFLLQVLEKRRTLPADDPVSGVSVEIVKPFIHSLTPSPCWRRRG